MPPDRRAQLQLLGHNVQSARGSRARKHLNLCVVCGAWLWVGDRGGLRRGDNGGRGMSRARWVKVATGRVGPDRRRFIREPVASLRLPHSSVDARAFRVLVRSFWPSGLADDDDERRVERHIDLGEHPDDPRLPFAVPDSVPDFVAVSSGNLRGLAGSVLSLPLKRGRLRYGGECAAAGATGSDNEGKSF
eukprot:6345429-Prymnesium_polylepis.1